MLLEESLQKSLEEEEATIEKLEEWEKKRREQKLSEKSKGKIEEKMKEARKNSQRVQNLLKVKEFWVKEKEEARRIVEEMKGMKLKLSKEEHDLITNKIKALD